MASSNGSVSVTTASINIVPQDAGVKQTILSNNGTVEVWLHFGAGPAIDNEGTKLAAAGSFGDRIHFLGGMAQSEIFGIAASGTNVVGFSRITDL